MQPFRCCKRVFFECFMLFKTYIIAFAIRIRYEILLRAIFLWHFSIFESSFHSSVSVLFTFLSCSTVCQRTNKKSEMKKHKEQEKDSQPRKFTCKWTFYGLCYLIFEALQLILMLICSAVNYLHFRHRKENFQVQKWSIHLFDYREHFASNQMQTKCKPSFYAFRFRFN